MVKRLCRWLVFYQMKIDTLCYRISLNLIKRWLRWKNNQSSSSSHWVVCYCIWYLKIIKEKEKNTFQIGYAGILYLHIFGNLTRWKGNDRFNPVWLSLVSELVFNHNLELRPFWGAVHDKERQNNSSDHHLNFLLYKKKIFKNRSMILFLLQIKHLRFIITFNKLDAKVSNN